MADRELRDALEKAQAELARLKREHDALGASKAEADRRAQAAVNASRLEAESAAGAAEAERRRVKMLEDQLAAAQGHLVALEAERQLHALAEAGEKARDGAPAARSPEREQEDATTGVIIGPTDEERHAPVRSDEFGPLSRAALGLFGIAFIVVDALELAKSGNVSGWAALLGVVLLLLAIKLR